LASREGKPFPDPTKAITKIGITRPLNSRLWLNFFSNLLLVRKVKSGALIGQKRVKLERELRGLVIPIFHIVRMKKTIGQFGVKKRFPVKLPTGFPKPVITRSREKDLSV
jgi:hypothetical protein